MQIYAMGRLIGQPVSPNALLLIMSLSKVHICIYKYVCSYINYDVFKANEDYRQLMTFFSPIRTNTGTVCGNEVSPEA